jgi:hypothetical protein
MAYNRRKIVAYGGVGVVIATSIILTFLWAPFVEVGLVPIVELESVMPGTLAITIVADNPDITVEQLMLTIDRLQVKLRNEDWTELEIPGGKVSFDLLNRQGSFIDSVLSQLEAGTIVKMHIVQQMGKIDQPVSQYANATLSNRDVVSVDLPSEEIELMTPITMSLRVYIVKS